MSIGEEVDKLDFKQKECIGELVKLFQIIEENPQKWEIWNKLEQLLMDWDEEAYVRYIENKKDRKLTNCVDLLFDLTDRDEAVLCYYHNRRGVEGDMAGNGGVLWNVLIQCVSDGLEECGKSIEDLVWELRDEGQGRGARRANYGV